MVAAIQAWYEATGEPPRFSDWDPAVCRVYAGKMRERSRSWLMRAQRYQEEEWPSSSHVRDLFGSWNKAIEAAGLRPRMVGRQERSTFLITELEPIDHAVAIVEEAAFCSRAELAKALVSLARTASRVAKEISG